MTKRLIVELTRWRGVKEQSKADRSTDGLHTPRVLALNPTGLFGGAEVSLLRLLDAARRSGWEVEVAAPSGPMTAHLAARHIPHHQIPECKLPTGFVVVAAARMLVHWLRAGRAARGLTRRADVVLANGVLALPPVALSRGRRPIVWYVHDVVTRRAWRWIARWAGRHVTIAVAPSDAVARTVEPLLHAPVEVVEHGTPWPVMPGRAADAGFTSDGSRPVIGLVGNLTPLKGQDVLLEAVADLPEIDVELVGATFPKDDQFEAKLHARAARPDLHGRVRFVGPVPDAVERMRSWRVAVSASVEPEAFGLSVLEAMSIGLPVVATAHGGPVEVLDDVGVLVPPRDASALGDGIRRLLDPEVARVHCDAGRSRVAAHYRLDQEEPRLVGVLARARAARVSITWVTPDVVQGLGGTSRQTINVASRLAERGHPVRLVTRRRERSLPAHELVQGLPVHRIGLPGNGAIAEKLAVAQLAIRLLRRRRDVVQVLMYPDYAVAAALAGRARRTVMTWAGLGDATDALGATSASIRRVARAVRRRLLRTCTHSVLTETMERELSDLGFASVVIPVPVDLDYFRPPTSAERAAARQELQIARGELVVLTVGQLRRLKAIDVLIEAVSSARDEYESVRLIIVGGASGTSDSCEDELREQVQQLALNEVVTFTGTVRDVRRLLWAADIFALPSRREGMPNSLVEAMACGIACIAPAAPVGHEVLGDAGVVTADGSAAALREAIVMLAGDDVMRRRLGDAARQRSRRWALGSVLHDHEALYAAVSGAS